MSSPDELLERLERLLEQLERLPEPEHTHVFEFLEGLDHLHRAAVEALAEELDGAELARIAAARPAVSWLLMAYGVAVDQRPEAEAALARVRREATALGGTLDVVDAREGSVRVRLRATSSETEGMLERSAEDALRAHMPTFTRLERVDDEAPLRRSPGVALPIHHVTPEEGSR